MRIAAAGAAALLLLLATAGCGLPRWPAEGPVTSPFGLRLRDSGPQIHRGIDVAMPEGTPVGAMTRGRVRFAGQLRGYGLTVIIDHPGATRSLYAHLSEIRVRQGDAVRAGQVIALSGRTGNVTGAHLHFEVLRWGRHEDPVPLLGRHPRPRRS
jgi:murein DD-endopeptidase MepM/ murein hydrolase activator NlpD